jgi:spore germination protein GerM
MNRFWKTPLFIGIAVMLFAGCGQKPGADGANVPNNEPNNAGAVQPGGQTGKQPAGQTGGTAGENDVSPVPPAKPEKVKKTVTLYFADSDLMKMYKLQAEIEADKEEELPKAALNTWMKGPGKEGLANLVPPGVVVESVTFKDKVATVSFSKELKNANLGSSGELYLIDQIALIMKQFGYDETQILIEGKAEESLLGHVSTDKPVKPSDPNQYELWK